MFGLLEHWKLRPARDYDACGAGFILGNIEVSPLDLAVAYSALARGGLAQEVKMFEDDLPPRERVLTEEAATIVADILCDNHARQQAFGTNSPLATRVRVAAKTGTSSGFRDAWTAGFTARHTVVVWVGNADGTPMNDLLAIRSAAPLWRRIVDMLVEGGDPGIPPAERPGMKLERADVCERTGLLPGKLSAQVVTESFIAGTTPQRDSSSMLEPADDGAVSIVLPDEYAAWCAGPFNNIHARVNSGPLRILEPASGALYKIDRALPRAQQVLELKTTAAVAGSTAPGIAWMINGVPVDADSSGRYFWKLEPGNWVAAFKSGTISQNAEFRVE
jgi:penicillin-binding protein 1C